MTGSDQSNFKFFEIPSAKVGRWKKVELWRSPSLVRFYPSSHLTPHHRDWIPHPTNDLLQFFRLLTPAEVCGVKSLFRAQRACAHVPCLPPRNNNRWSYVLSSKQASWNAFPTVVLISSLLRHCRLVRTPAVFTTPWFRWHSLSSPLPPPAFLNTTDGKIHHVRRRHRPCYNSRHCGGPRFRPHRFDVHPATTKKLVQRRCRLVPTHPGIRNLQLYPTLASRCTNYSLWVVAAGSCFQ